MVAMSETTESRTATVGNPQGLHARPADLFVKEANKFDSKIEVIKDGRRVEAKSILGILTLGAVQGVQLCIEATGHDAQQALDALAKLIESDFADEATPETSDQDQEQA